MGKKVLSYISFKRCGIYMLFIVCRKRRRDRNKQTESHREVKEGRVRFSLRSSSCTYVEADNSGIPRKMYQAADFEVKNVGSEFMR